MYMSSVTVCRIGGQGDTEAEETSQVRQSLSHDITPRPIHTITSAGHQGGARHHYLDRYAV